MEATKPVLKKYQLRAGEDLSKINLASEPVTNMQQMTDLRLNSVLEFDETPGASCSKINQLSHNNI